MGPSRGNPHGSHAGFILYETGQFADGDMDKMRETLKRSKGPGNCET